MLPPLLPLREAHRLRHRDDLGLYRLQQGQACGLARHFCAHGANRGWVDSRASARGFDLARVSPVHRATSHRLGACELAALKSRRRYSQRKKETCTQQSGALFSPGLPVESPSALLHRVRAYRVPTTRLTLRTTVHNAHT